MLEREELEGWSRELEFFWVSQVGWRFARAEARERGLKYVKGLLSDAKRKNGWQLAEMEGETQVDGMQRVLNGSVWDTDGVREWVAECIGAANGVLVVDETGFLKKGNRSAGVKRQYSGTAGRIENCQVGVFVAYTQGNDYALIDRELYLPEEWANDTARRAEADIPEHVAFATKGALARTMLERTFASGLPFGWVTADSIYGGDYKIRKLLEDHACSYVLAVNSTHKVWYGFEQIAVEGLLMGQPKQVWQRLSCGTGAKGERLYDWAFLPLPRIPDNDRFGVGVLVRRSLTDAKLTY
jgi:SRSO17 transposase